MLLLLAKGQITLCEITLRFIKSELLIDRTSIFITVTKQPHSNKLSDNYYNNYQKEIKSKNGVYIRVHAKSLKKAKAKLIGMLTPKNTPVPDGFISIDFENLSLGTCWIYGKENEVHDTSACKQKIAESGMKIWQDENGAIWSFENCLCPRYTTPDDNGNVILDYCYFVSE